MRSFIAGVALETNKSCGIQARSMWQSAEMQRYSIGSPFRYRFAQVAIYDNTHTPPPSRARLRHNFLPDYCSLRRPAIFCNRFSTLVSKKTSGPTDVFPVG